MRLFCQNGIHIVTPFLSALFVFSSGPFNCAVIRQKKYLRAKFGDGDDEMADDDKDKDEEEKRSTWGGRSGLYHSGDNVDFDVRSVLVS